MLSVRRTYGAGWYHYLREAFKSAEQNLRTLQGTRLDILNVRREKLALGIVASFDFFWEKETSPL